jgi:hypothetical protein
VFIIATIIHYRRPRFPAIRRLAALACAAAHLAVGMEIDHIAYFAAGPVCENFTRAIEVRAGSVELAAAELAATVSRETDSSPVPAFPSLASSWLRPPDSLRLLRSTVLVV